MVQRSTDSVPVPRKPIVEPGHPNFRKGNAMADTGLQEPEVSATDTLRLTAKDAAEATKQAAAEIRTEIEAGLAASKEQVAGVTDDAKIESRAANRKHGGRVRKSGRRVERSIGPEGTASRGGKGPRFIFRRTARQNRRQYCDRSLRLWPPQSRRFHRRRGLGGLRGRAFRVRLRHQRDESRGRTPSRRRRR